MMSHMMRTISVRQFMLLLLIQRVSVAFAFPIAAPISAPWIALLGHENANHRQRPRPRQQRHVPWTINARHLRWMDGILRTDMARGSETEGSDFMETSTSILEHGVGEQHQFNEALWKPSSDYKTQTLMYKFLQHVRLLNLCNNIDENDEDNGYEGLWKWSVQQSDLFWSTLLDFLRIQYTGSKDIVKEGSVMPDVTYFPDVQLNFAQNLLRYSFDAKFNNAEAIISISEARPDRRWTFDQLREDVSRVSAALAKRVNITQHDAVGAYMPNLGETIVAMLGTTSVGAVWSSCSPDFGAQAVADRFGQIQPKVLFTVNGYISKNETTCLLEKVEALVQSLPSLERVVVIELISHNQKKWAASERLSELIVSWDDFLQQGSLEDGSAPDNVFAAVPFAHPQFVLYSSGTTGMPKSIAHGAGNVLLQHAKELMLHSDVRPGDRILFFTTCGWMMWNWMVSALYAGSTVVCFDGFAAHPRLSSPWELVARERITHLGTTPRYLQACRKRVRPGTDYDLSALRVVFSTGSPLTPEDFDYVYQHIQPNVLLASISGGTDICSCFALGNPLLPVRKSELQAIGLGLDVCAYNVDDKTPAPWGQRGELVCRAPFVAAPVKFWGDDVSKSKYRAAYFRDDDPGIWYHGDWVEITGSVGSAGGLIIHGRSDTTLKPGGVRIGTAEVYRFAEEVDVVQDSLVIGLPIQSGKRAGDVRIVLFVQLLDGVTLTPDIEDRIRSTIRSGASDAHVPTIIQQVKNIPYTKSGKKVEIAIRDLIAYGIEPKNVGALLDPNVLDEYRTIARENRLN